MAGPDVSHTVLAALKRARPARCAVFIYDEAEPKVIAVPAKRKRWVGLAKMLSQYDWTHLEALNNAGEIIDTIENDRFDPGELEDLDGGPAKTTTEVANLVKIALTAQDHALQRQQGQFQAVLDAVVGLFRVMTERQVALEKQASQQWEQLRAYALAAGEGDDDLQSTQALLQLAPVLAGGAPVQRPAPNGRPPRKRKPKAKPKAKQE